MSKTIDVKVSDLIVIRSMAECGDDNEVIRIVNAIFKENNIEE